MPIRAITRACRPLTTITAPQSARAMGTFFPHFPQHTFAPLFRDFDSLLQPEAFGFRSQQQTRPFAPRFDVQENPSAYELHGELPGIKQEDVDIQFVDANTLVIKGKTTREYTRTNDNDVNGKTIEGSSTPKAIHKASVEDEPEDGGAERDGSAAKEGAVAPTSSTSTEVAPAANEAKPGHRYWVSERSVGEFQRTFSFPGKVDQEAVKASLKNGILSIVVPKAAKKQERKIAIESVE